MAALSHIGKIGPITALFCWLAALYIRLVYATSRWQTVGGEHPRRYWDAGEPFICCFWHGRLMMMHKIWPRGFPIHVLISQHRDGRLIARTIEHFGVSTIAGSTSRGASAAYRAILRALAAGESVCFTPDGPRGPRMRMSPGIIATASRTGRPILCGTYSTTRRRLLNSWDRFLVPLPFGRGVFVCSPPIFVPRDADAEALERARREAEDQLNAITREADRLCGWPEMTPAADGPRVSGEIVENASGRAAAAGGGQ